MQGRRVTERRDAEETKLPLLAQPLQRRHDLAQNDRSVEGAVVAGAMDVIASGQPKMLEFGVADETAWNVGLSCGGTIRVFVEKVG